LKKGARFAHPTTIKTEQPMRLLRVIPFVVAWLPAVVLAQEYKVEALKEAPPSALSGAVKGVIENQGYHVLDDQGKPYADLWLRKAIPASSKPAGPKGAIQFPFLDEGELLGVLRFPGEGHDYRDQTIAKGVYTLRYGLQPQNGDHLGVSEFRDYMLLVPAAKDKELANLPQKKLEGQSAESAGTSHPAVLLLLSAPGSAASSGLSLIHNEEKATWGVVMPLSLSVAGESSPIAQPVQLIIIGAAMN
jgi:hypothetical protein